MNIIKEKVEFPDYVFEVEFPKFYFFNIYSVFFTKKYIFFESLKCFLHKIKDTKVFVSEGGYKSDLQPYIYDLSNGTDIKFLSYKRGNDWNLEYFQSIARLKVLHGETNHWGVFSDVTLDIAIFGVAKEHIQDFENCFTNMDEQYYSWKGIDDYFKWADIVFGRKGEPYLKFKEKFIKNYSDKV
jgi:hypothetical protein